MATIVLIGTCDSKLEELLFLREQILSSGASKVTLIDAGRRPVQHEAIDLKQDAVLQFNSGESIDLESATRGEVIRHMIKCASACVSEEYRNGRMQGIIAAGGSGGSSLAAAVMRDTLPIGFPKMLVSTVASGDTGPYVGETDISMMYSVVDIAGSNSLLRTILSNAAGAIVGMAEANQRHSKTARQETGSRKRVGTLHILTFLKTPEADNSIKGITMFGVTTPGVDAARQHLESKYNCEVLIFHATGHGGLAMERLVRENGLDAVLDITTTEICDLIAGGNMSAGPHRLEAAAEAGIPYVLSLGATSMVNFGARATVPLEYNDRLLYEHNPTVTLMRTSREECVKIGEFIVDKLTKHSQNPEHVQIVLPLGGVCMISTPQGPFANAEADQAMFDTVRSGLKDSKVLVIEDSRDINDSAFATEIADRLGKML